MTGASCLVEGCLTVLKCFHEILSWNNIIECHHEMSWTMLVSLHKWWRAVWPSRNAIMKYSETSSLNILKYHHKVVCKYGRKITSFKRLLSWEAKCLWVWGWMGGTVNTHKPLTDCSLHVHDFYLLLLRDHPPLKRASLPPLPTPRSKTISVATVFQWPLATLLNCKHW